MLYEVLMSNFREQAYARVTGTLKSLEGKRYLNTKQIRLSLDPHEAYFHILDAMLVNRKLEIQSVSGRQSFTSSAGRHALAEGTSGNTSDD